MAKNSEKDDDPHDAVSHRPLPKLTTATNKQQRLTTTTETLTSMSPSLSSPSDDASLPTLPFDLVVEILYRLPVNSLIQFQCVCKSWYSLISNPKFAKTHLRRLRRPHFTGGNHLVTSLRNSDSDDVVLRSYPLSAVLNAESTSLMHTPPLNWYSLNIGTSHFSEIVGSCDGILCLDISTDYVDRCSFVLLWNPSISKFKILPPLEIDPLLERSASSFTIYGFGYDHLTHSYKVVAVFCYIYNSDILQNQFGAYKTQVKVHTLGTNSWRRIQDFPKGGELSGKSGIFVNGKLNWSAYINSSFSWVIISLDLGNETYQEILQPDYRKDHMLTLTLGVLRDCLCIFFEGNFSTDVWIMNEYGKKESWTKLFSLHGLHNGYGCLTKPRPLFISEDDDVLLELNSRSRPIAVYNSRNGTLKVPGVPDFSSSTSVVFMDSLISPCP